MDRMETSPSPLLSIGEEEVENHSTLCRDSKMKRLRLNHLVLTNLDVTEKSRTGNGEDLKISHGTGICVMWPV